MVSYKRLYFKLTAQLADAIEVLDMLSESLKEAQRALEESVIIKEE